MHLPFKLGSAIEAGGGGDLVAEVEANNDGVADFGKMRAFRC